MGAAFDLATKLGGSKPNGRGGFLAYCPVHEADGRAHDPSLNIDDGEDVPLVVFCLVGCDQKRVVEKIKALGLWPSPNGKGPATRALKSVAAVWKPVPPTVDTPAPPLAHPKRGKPNGLWIYRDAEGRPFTADFRFDLLGGKKDVLPCTWAQSDSGARAWRWMHAKPRPIYGLDRLAARPGASVLLVSGCKCADVGHRIATAYVVVTWQGGDDSVGHVGWNALAGRTVIIWSDHDPSGIKSMRKAESLLKLLGCRVLFVQIPAGASVSWDIADAEAEGMGAAAVIALIEAATETPPGFVKPESSATTAGKPGDVPEYSESALVDQFEQFCGGMLNHCRDHWNGWTGRQWRPGDKFVFDIAETVARAVAVKAMYDPKLKSAAESTARRLASAHTFKAIESIAKNRNSLSSEPKDWDADPFLLGTPDGVIDLRTGNRLDPKREYRITKSTAVVPAKTSDDADQWMKALDLIYQGDAEQIEHVQKVLGYCSTGDVREDLIAVATGRGGNGKTVVWATAARILGTYAHVLAAEALMETSAARHPEELARLQGMRLWLASEIPEGKIWNAERLKMLSGRDDIPARDMYGKSFSFSPSGKLIIYGNQLPGLRTVDVAITGRMRIIPHPVLIRGTPLDIKGLDQKLISEWPSILRWMIEGTQKWLRDGLKPPAAMVNATRDYFAAEDEFGGWLSVCCLPCEMSTALARLKQSFDHWRNPNEDKSVKGIDPTTLARKLRKKGYKTEHTRNGTVVWGLKIPEPVVKAKAD